MADTVVNEYAQFNLWEVQDIVIDLYEQLDVDEPQAKRAMSTIIAQIMLCAEVAGTESWEEAKEAITDVFRFPEAPMMDLLKHVFENLHNHPFWTISEEFILILGEQYFAILMQRRFRVFE